VGSQRTNILVDVGLSGKSIVSSLNEIGISPKSIDGLLITHEHSDHVRGAGIFSRMFNIPIYANNRTWESMHKSIGKIKDENIKIINTDESFFIGDIEVKAYSIPHDAIDPVGYCFFNNGKKVSIATDIGHLSENVLNNIKGSDLVLLESNHDVEMLKVGPYPYILKRRILGDRGHLSNDDAGKAILRLVGEKFITVVLGHLSQQNNYPELAYRTVLSILEENGVYTDRDLKLDLAHRSSVGTFFQVG